MLKSLNENEFCNFPLNVYSYNKKKEEKRKICCWIYLYTFVYIWVCCCVVKFWKNEKKKEVWNIKKNIIIRKNEEKINKWIYKKGKNKKSRNL